MPEFLTAAEVAAELRRDVAWVNRQAQSRVIPAKKVGRYWRFTRDGVDEYLRRVDNQATDPMAMSAASASRRRVS
jgi:excisionase family DNA binding protein